MILEAGAQGPRVQIDPRLGGRITSLFVGGRERILQTPATSPVEPALRFGCYLMAPWGGRIKNGLLEWRGRSVVLRRNLGEHAIHGVVFDEPSEVVEADSSHIVLAQSLNTTRWPFAGRLTQRYRLDEAGLDVAAELEAEEAMPAALGWHPWFARFGEMRVQVAGDATLELDEDLIPTGALLPVDERTDLRSPASVEGRRLDDAYASVASPMRLFWPDLELQISFGPPVSTAVVFIAAEAVCVEPATAWPDAVRLSQQGCDATGIAVLEPGERLVARTRWSWRAT